MASGAQLTTTVFIVAALIVAALKWPAAKRGTPAPHAVVLFLAALISGSALMVLQQVAQSRMHWNFD